MCVSLLKKKCLAGGGVRQDDTEKFEIRAFSKSFDGGEL